MRFETPRARRPRVDAAPLAAAIIGLALMSLPGAAQTSVVADQAYSIAAIGVHVQKYLDIPDAAKGPAIPDRKAFRIQELGTDLYMISDNVYQSMFLVYDTGVVVVDAPPAYASHIPGAIAEITARPITHVIYSHSHSDHVGGTTKLGGNPIIIAHEESPSPAAKRGGSQPPPPAPAGHPEPAAQRRRGDERGGRSRPGADDQERTGGQRSCAHDRARHRCGRRPAEHAQALRGLLHDKERWHGDRAVGQPLDHRATHPDVPREERRGGHEARPRSSLRAPQRAGVDQPEIEAAIRRAMVEV